MSIERSAVSVVKYLLNLTEKKLPLKKSDLMGVVKDSGQSTKNFPDILLRAERDFAKIFGYRIQEVTVKNAKVYLIVPNNITSHLVLPPDKQPEVTLLYLTLAYVFMKGDRVMEPTLWKYLEGLDIFLDESEIHPYFGNVKKLITETFVKQLYLIREKVDEEGETEFIYYYSWGPRSTHELPKRAVLEYVAKLLKRPPKCFVEQHKQVGGDRIDAGESSQTPQTPASLTQTPQQGSSQSTSRSKRSTRSQR